MSRVRFPSSSRFWSAAWAFALACTPAATPPHPAPSGEIGVPAAASSVPAPFALVHFGPRGEALADPAVQLVFNRPLRSLDLDAPPPPGIRLDPPIPGAWQWVGTQGLTFVPAAGHLPRATELSVEVPADLRALDGSLLGQAQKFTFTTPLPQVVSFETETYGEPIGPAHPLRFRFSEPMRPGDLEGFVRIRAGDAAPVQVQLSSDRDDPNVIWVRPRVAWPRDVELLVEVGAGYRGSGGPLPARQVFQEKVRTYPPLTASVQCDRDAAGRCRPDGWFALELSNPVSVAALGPALSSSDGVPLGADLEYWEGAKTKYLSLSPRAKPGQSFAISIGAAVRDVYGQALSAGQRLPISIGDYAATARIGFEGELLSRQVKQVEVFGLNADVEVVAAPLPIEKHESLLLAPYEDRFAFVQKLPSVWSARLERGKKNETARLAVSLDRAVGRPSGGFAVGVRYRDDRGEWRSEVKTGQRTGLGVTVKQGRTTSQVWVTDVETGAPLSGAVVRARSGAASFRTGADGVALLPAGIFPPDPNHERVDLIESSYEGDVAILASRDAIGPWRLPVSTDFWGQERDLGLVFAERDLFRPGETARVKAYLRRPAQGQNQILEGEQVTLRLTSPDGEVVAQASQKTNRFGGVSAELAFPQTARHGDWALGLVRGKEELATTYLQVRSYRPAEFEVSTRAARAEALPGDRLSFAVSGRYFFGGVMGEAPTKLWVTRHPAHFAPPGTEAFETTDDAYYWDDPAAPPNHQLLFEESKLDALGELHKDVTARLPGQRGPERIELEAEVSDVSAQAQAGRTGVLVHPGSYYVGIERAGSIFAAVGEVFQPRVQAFSPTGQTLVRRTITLELLHQRWVEVVQTMSPGHQRTVRSLVRDPVARCSVVTTVSSTSCDLHVKKAGQYVLRIASTDDQGRVVHASRYFYGFGAGHAGFRDDVERGSLAVKLDRESYVVGDRARLLLQSPFEKARAWVTIEREGVQSSFVREVSGGTPIVELPVTEDFAPNVMIGVHLLEDRRALGKSAHEIAESYRVGYAALRVDPAAKRLTVHVTPDATEYRPGSEVALTLDVKDVHRQGTPAEVALFVVDEGVLALSGYQLPDPLATFTAERPLRVETIEARETLARLVGLDPARRGGKGDPGGDGGEARSSFLTTAYFHPGLATDAEGRASVRFRLPDNVGRFRVMAMAVTAADQYGTGRGDLVVQKKLMARPALPRFLRAGDRFEASIVVSSLLPQKETVQVEVSATEFSLEGPSEKSIVVPAGGSVLVGFPALAPRAGEGRITFSVASAGQKDRVELRRSVQSPSPLETVAAYGTTTDARAERLSVLEGAEPGRGGLSVSVSSSALVGLAGSLERLRDYPYACTEQLTSQLLPEVALRALRPLLGPEEKPASRAAIEKLAAQILLRQRGDGGFGLWPESYQSEPWLSGYALLSLAQAKKSGARVPKAAFERGRYYLERIATEREKAKLPAVTMAAFALVHLGHADVSTLEVLVGRRDELDPASRALLLWALAESKRDQAVQTLLPEIESLILVRGNRAELRPAAAENPADYSSPVRDHALVLGALSQARPGHPLLAPLVRGLLEARRQGSFGSTQETALALWALETFAGGQKPAQEAFVGQVFLAEKPVFEARFAVGPPATQSFEVPMTGLVPGSDLVFSSPSGQELHYEARLRYARRELPRSPEEQGFALTRAVRQVRAEEIRSGAPGALTSSPELGSLVLVELTVLAPEARENVVLDAPLPAGLEAVDFHLTTTAGQLPSVLPDGFSYAWFREELRDDRALYFVDHMPAGLYRYRFLARATTRGKYVVPPARVMEMYQEEVFGRTGAEVLEVR